MKNFRVFVAVFVLISVVSSTHSAAQCRDTLWNHVYHSYRLYLHDSCVTISGTVWSLLYEADGDIHIRISLDSPYVGMLNAGNIANQYGKMVVEPVCATTCTQTDAIASCQGFTNTVFIPAPSEHVTITGPYVTDNDHGWNEIHPVNTIVISPPLGTPAIAATSERPDVTVFPNPATTLVNFGLSQAPSTTVFITISDELGRLAGQYQMLNSKNLEINTSYLNPGKYYYHVNKDNRMLKSGFFVVAK